MNHHILFSGYQLIVIPKNVNTVVASTLWISQYNNDETWGATRRHVWGDIQHPFLSCFGYIKKVLKLKGRHWSACRHGLQKNPH